MQITPQILDNLMLNNNGLYYLPDRVRIAIESCIESDDEKAVTKEYLRLVEEYQKHEKEIAPMEINYRGSITLDAYASYYFARNFCIPLIGLRDLTYNPLFQNIPDTLNVLDVGQRDGRCRLWTTLDVQ